MKVLLIYNPYSTGYKEKRIKRIIDLFQNNNYDISIFKPEYKNHIYDYLVKTANSFELIAIAGGDGTIHEVVLALENIINPPKLFIFPMGGCNDIALSLGYYKNIYKNFEILRKNITKEISSYKINDSYFLYAFALGMMTDVSYNTSDILKKRIKRLAYYFNCIKSLFKSSSMNIKINDDKYNKYQILLILHTNKIAGYKTNSSIYDNSLKLIGITGNKVIALFKFIMLMFFKIEKNLLVINGNKFTIQLNNSININLDGEKYISNNIINITEANKFIFINKE